MKKIIYLIIAVALMCGCAEKEEAEVTTGNVVGTVFNKATGEPRGGVNVCIGASGLEGYVSISSYVTGNDGRYSFENIPTYSKTIAYRINIVWVVGETGSRREISISPGQTITADISY